MAEVQLPPQPPHKKMLASHGTHSDVDTLNNEEVDEYSTYKRLQRELEYIQLQEEYIKDEQRWDCDCLMASRIRTDAITEV